VVERTFAWIGRGSRLAKDFEATIERVIAWVLVAHIRRHVSQCPVIAKKNYESAFYRDGGADK
jgi:hypothetical protein